MSSVREYEATLDARNRLTVREAGYRHYHVKEFEDGTIVLEPRVLVSPNVLTAETIRDSKAGRNVKEFDTVEELFEDLEG